MPAWIYPIRLTRVANAHERLNAICRHLKACTVASSGLHTVEVTEHRGLVAGRHNRSEVAVCWRHAEMLVTALGWVRQDEEMGESIVTECHAAQSSGGADLVLMRGHCAWLFEAAAGTGINRRKKHRVDSRKLQAEQNALLNGDVVQVVRKFRVVPEAVVADLPRETQAGVVVTLNDVSIIAIPD